MEKKLPYLAVKILPAQLVKVVFFGDKTRMQELSKIRYAFIRSSPTGHSLGGLLQKNQKNHNSSVKAAGFEYYFGGNSR